MSASTPSSVWSALRNSRRSAPTRSRAERRQNLRWFWALVEEQLRQAVHTHPAVRAIQDDLEREVLAGITPAAVAACRALEAFGLRPSGAPGQPQ
jgi:LAO/AO transport system kinase